MRYDLQLRIQQHDFKNDMFDKEVALREMCCRIINKIPFSDLEKIFNLMVINPDDTDMDSFISSNKLTEMQKDLLLQLRANDCVLLHAFIDLPDK